MVLIINICKRLTFALAFKKIFERFEFAHLVKLVFSHFPINGPLSMEGGFLFWWKKISIYLKIHHFLSVHLIFPFA